MVKVVRGDDGISGNLMEDSSSPRISLNYSLPSQSR